MQDLNQLLQQLGGGNADSQLVRQVQAVTDSAQGRALAAQLQSASAEEMRQAVQRGSAADLHNAVGQFLSSPEGARLAEQLRQMLGK